MKNFIAKGDTMAFVAGSTLLSGAVVAFGAGYGVACDDVANTAAGQLLTEGVVKLTSDTGTAYVSGDRLYWDAGSTRVTKTASGNKAIGYAWGAKASATAYAYVKLVPFVHQAATIAAIATADGSDAATTQALANAIKVKVNAILVVLKDVGLMA